MIERCGSAFPIRVMCRCLKVSTSGYYAWRGRPQSPRGRDNARLTERIRALHEASDGVLGSPRIWEELQNGDETCSRNCVAQLMRAQDSKGIPQRWDKKPSGTRPEGVRNVLQRNYATDHPNTKWVTDITFISTLDKTISSGMPGDERLSEAKFIH